jgi:hypothetical protein
MKTTFDLPYALVKKVKLRALQEGRKLRDTVADLLISGLAAASNQPSGDTDSVIGKDKVTGLPVIHCKHAAPPQHELTPQRVADILLHQETDWHHDAGR